MPQWSLHLLGPPRLERNGSRIKIHRRKVMALLIYLAVTERSHSRDSLAALLWPECQQAEARAALRRTLSELLKILDGKFILVEQDTIELNSNAEFWLDIHEFHFRINAYSLHGHPPADPCRDCLAFLAEAASLYQGEFLAGFSLPGSLDFDEWQIQQAETLHLEQIGGLSRLARGHLACGDITLALDYARRWQALDPLDENAVRLLMQLYAWSGKRNEAVHQYHLFSENLKHELRLQPQNETTQLFERIQSQQDPPPPQPASSPKRPNNFPVQLTSFIGRVTELNAIKEKISQPDVHLLTLTGPGGVGKTRLSLEIAAQLLDQYEDGAFFIPLAALHDTDLIVPAIASALGVREVKGVPLKETLKTHVRDRQILLVLDNFEHLLRAAPLVTEILSAAPRLKIIVTSRSILHVYGENLYPVPPLSFPGTREAITAEKLSQSEAVQLFLERAQAVKPEFQLSDDNGQTILEICTRLDGLPLALELAAARTRQFAPQMMLNQWTREGGKSPLKTLTDGPRDRSSRHQTLRNAIDWSYNLLKNEEQVVFRRAGIFVGDWTLSAAENVISAISIDGDHGNTPVKIPVASALESLADHHMLSHYVQNGEKCFSMLETIREFALEQLRNANHEENMIQDAHAQYYLSFVEVARQNMFGAEQTSWINRIAREYNNIRTALKWLISQKNTEMALRFGAALGRFWYLYDPNVWSEGRNWLERALALPASETATQEVRAKALNEIGVLAWAQGDYGEAIRFFEACLTLKRKLGDQIGVGSALGNLGLVAREQHDFIRAQKYQEESLAIKREFGDKQGIANALANLGLVVADRGDWVYARRLLEEGIALDRELQNQAGLTTTLHNLGGILVENLEELPQAKSFLEESLTLSRKLGKNFFLIPYTCNHLGNLALYQNDFEQARIYFEEGLSLSRESNNKFAAGYALHSLGYLYYLEDEDEKASECLVQSMKVLNEANGLVGMVWNFITLAGLACKKGQPLRAVTLLGAGDRLREKTCTALTAAKANEYRRYLKEARAQISDADFNRSWSAGRVLSHEEAVAYAIVS